MTELVSTDSNKLPDKTKIKRSFLGIKERHEEQLNELLLQVAQKLMKHMIKGRVGFFHDKETGQLETEIYRLDLKSQKHPQVQVDAWKHFLHRRNQIGPEIKLLFSIFDYYPEKPDNATRISIVQNWDDQPSNFKLKFNHNDHSIPHREKIKLLKEILDLEVDEDGIAKYFGRPYHKGDFVDEADDGWQILHHDGKEMPRPDLHRSRGRTGTGIEDSNSNYSSYWVRDLWSGEGSLLDSGPLPEPKRLKE